MNTWKKLFLVYFVMVMLKVVMAYFIPSISAFSDEYIYAKMARSFFFFGDFFIHEGVTSGYPFLYPLVLSVSYLFNDMTWVYLAMKVINAFISSLIIFPVFLLAREFLDKKKSLMIALLVSIIPITFAFSNYILAENLLYPLFMFAMYFIYKSFVSNKFSDYILAFLFSSLCILTKANGVILLLILFIIPFVSYFILKNKKINKLTFIIPLIAIIGAISIYSTGIFSDIFGRYTSIFLQLISFDYPWINFITKFLSSFGFILLGSGVIFLIMALFIKFNNYKIKLFVWIASLTSFFVLLSMANHGFNPINNVDYGKDLFFSWFHTRIIGRYIDMLLPLVFILGFIGFKNFEINYKENKSKLLKLLIIFTPIVGYTSLLTLFSLFPINNMSLTWLGIIKYISDSLFFNISGFEVVKSLPGLILFGVFLILLLWMFYGIYKLGWLRTNRLYFAFVMFFLLVSLSAYSVTYYNSTKYWYGEEQMQLGLWFNEYDKGTSTVLFDVRDCTGQILKEKQDTLCEPSKKATIAGFWMNDNIIIRESSNLEDIDYVVTKHNLDLNLIKESSAGSIKIYKVAN